MTRFAVQPILDWKSEVPSKSGWYWIKNTKTNIPSMAYIETNFMGNTNIEVMNGMGYGKREYSIYRFLDEGVMGLRELVVFAGPLTPPEDRE